MKIAYRERIFRRNNPKVQYRDNTDLIFYHERYGVGRYLGNAKHHVSRHIRKGFGFRTGTDAVKWSNDIDDLRIVPDQAAGLIAAYDRAIKDLIAERQQFLNDHFLEWRIPDISEAAEIKEGTTKAEALKSMKEQNQKPPSVNLKGERRLVETMNKAFKEI